MSAGESREDFMSSPQLSGKETSLRFNRASGGTYGEEGSRNIVEIQKSKIAECVESDLGKEFTSTKFEPMTRALKILGSINAEQELEALRRSWWEVDGLVNGVVEVHHVGFNGSLQDYSKINKLLKESQHALRVVRRNLMVAQDAIRVDQQGLLEHYNIYAVLYELTKLMKDIEWVCVAMGDLEVLQRENDWNGCIKILIQSSNTLARKEIVGIPAIQGLIQQVQSRAADLVERIVAEAEQQAFHCKPDVSEQRGSEWPLNHHRTIVRRRKSRISRFGSGLYGSQGSPMKFVQYLERDVSKHARSLSALGTASTSMIDGHMMNANFGASKSLISCISQLGGVSKAMQSIRQGTRQKLRDLLGRCLHRLGSGQMSGFSGLHTSNRSEYVMKAMLKKSDEVFKSVSAYIRQLALSRISAPSSGLTLLHGGNETDPMLGPEENDSGISIAFHECTALWESIQCELLHVVGAALGLRIQGSNGLDSDAMFSGMYWNNVSSKSLHDEGRTETVKTTNSLDSSVGVKFSMDEQLGAIDLSSFAKTEGFSSINLEHLIKTTIGEGSCIIQSAPSLYLPVKQFVSRCCKYLDDMETEVKKDIKASSRMNPVTEKILSTLSLNRFGDSSGDTKIKQRRKEVLLTYIIDVLRTDFVPNMYAECGHKTQALIASMTMTLQSHTGTYTVAGNTVNLVRDALKWASMAPVVAPNITGVLENSLGKAVESLQAQIHSLASGGLALTMAQDTNIIRLMAQEPIAGILGGPEWFVAVSTTMDSFLSSAIMSGFSQGREIWSKDLLKIFMEMRPLEKGSLVLQNNSAMRSIVSIAFIGQTAELISDGIYKLLESFGEASNTNENYIGKDDKYKSVEKGLTTGLLNIADQYRSVSGLCTRLLRIEAALHVLYAMQEIIYVSSADSIFESRIAQMAPKLASMDEVLTNHLPASRREYIFAPLSGFCMKAAVYLHKEIHNLDGNIIASIVRSLSGVQAVLGSLGLSSQGGHQSATGKVAGTKPLEDAKKYYLLSNETFDAIYNAAKDPILRESFEYEDWISLVNLATKSKSAQGEMADFSALFSK